MSSIRETINYLIRIFAEEKLIEQRSIDKVQYAGQMFGQEEYVALMEALYSGWLSRGKYTVETEKKIAQQSMRKHCLLCNSGSSANLLLMAAAKELYFKEGDKILTVACGFPTTVNPIVQVGLKPVFIDISLDNFDIDVGLFDNALRNDKNIKGAFIPNHLGFSNKMDILLDIAREHNVIVFFDCCDSYGSTYNGKPLQQYGKAATMSFYVSHLVSCGEGGGIVTNDDDLFTVMRGMRDWGRYCASENCCIRSVDPEAFCPSTKLTKDTELPEDYTVNYISEWMGYNLKMLELQSAILNKQLDRIVEFNKTRIENYNMLYEYMKSNKHNIRTWPLVEGVSPFAFPMLIPEDATFKRKHLMNFLQQNKIESRLLFAGNITKHPAYSKKPHLWEVYGNLSNSDNIMRNFIMLGVAPIITKDKILKIIDVLSRFFEEWK